MKFWIDEENRLFMETKDGKVWGVPQDPANSDYQAYLASLEEGESKAE